MPADPDFHDIFVPRVGGELTLLDGPTLGLVARAGYFYEPSPAPDQPGDTNYVDADKHAVAAGLGLRFTDPSGTFPQPLHLDVAGQFIRVVERTYHKTDPADPIGDYRAEGSASGGAATLGFEF
ncbi:MAG: hypothetical protein KC620_16195 [Myxococcales bacterium]|nr:hypothetical protein [Myxococcales bacterium]